MPTTSEPRFSAPTRVRLERVASTIGFVAFLASWVVAYTVVAPADRALVFNVGALQVRP